MGETELRNLAEELRADLPGLIVDRAERDTVHAALEQALKAPAGSAQEVLRTALESHPETRRWLRARRPDDSQRQVGIPGDPTTRLGVYFVCPMQDFDFVREMVSTTVPLCPTHRVTLVRQDG